MITSVIIHARKRGHLNPFEGILAQVLDCTKEIDPSPQLGASKMADAAADMDPQIASFLALTAPTCGAGAAMLTRSTALPRTTSPGRAPWGDEPFIAGFDSLPDVVLGSPT